MMLARRQFLGVAVAASAYAGLRPLRAFAVEPLDVLQSPKAVADVARSLHSKPLWEAVTALHVAMKVGGSLGIQRKKRTWEKPFTAEEVGRLHYGDCSDLTYWMVSGLVALGLDKREEVGALLIHIKGNPPDIWHVVPVLWVKEKPQGVPIYATEKDCYAVVIDAQAPRIGELGVTVDGKQCIPLAGLEAAYYREYGMHALHRGHRAKSQRMFERAIRRYDDPFAHTNLAHFLLQSRKPENIEKAVGHARIAHQQLPHHNGIKQNYFAALMQASTIAARAERFETAVAHLEAAQALAPKDERITLQLGVVYYNWGVQLYNSGQSTEGRAKLQRAADLGNSGAQQALETLK